MTALEVGLGFFTCQRGYTTPVSGPGAYRNAAEEVALAESAGFDSVWVAEHHFSHDGYSPAPLAACGFLAGATSRIQVGTSILVVPLHDPVRLAHGLRALKALAPGRLKLGVGLGYREVELAAFWKSPQHRAKAMERTLDHLIDEGALDDVELWMGGFSPPAIRRAGRYGASILLFPDNGSPVALGEVRDMWESELEPRPGQDPRLGLFLQSWPEEDQHEAHRLRAQVREEWLSYTRFFSEDPFLGASGAGRGGLAEQYAATALIGGPSMISDGLNVLIDAGVDTLILWPHFGSVATQRVRASIETLGSEVVPVLRDAR